MTTDVVDAAAVLVPDSAVAVLRRECEAFVRHTQGSHDALIAPADTGGVSLVERAAAAFRVASIERDAALIAHYRARLHAIGADVVAVEALDVPAAAGFTSRFAFLVSEPRDSAASVRSSILIAHSRRSASEHRDSMDQVVDLQVVHAHLA